MMSSMRTVLTVGVVIGLPPLAIDMYLPALPAMAEALESSTAGMQLTLTAFLLGLAIGPLILGPLSDAMGRRVTVLGALAAFVMASAGCALSEGAEHLILWRVVQAMFGGGAVVAALASLADRYSGDQLARATSLAMLSLTLAPILGPVAGAAVLEVAGWQVIFWVLAVSGAFGALLFGGLGETLPTTKRIPFSLSAVGDAYRDIASKPAAVLYIATVSFTALSYFTFIAVAPFLFIDKYNWSTRQFAASFVGVAIVAVIADLINAAIVPRFGYRRVLFWSACGLLVVGAWLILVVLAGWESGATMFLGVVWLMGLLHLISANAMTGLMDQIPNASGTAASVATSVRFLCGMVGTAALSLAGGGSMAFAVIVAVGGIGAMVSSTATAVGSQHRSV